MTCPRCGAGEILPDTNRCGHCGYSPAGAAEPLPTPGGGDEAVRRELGRVFDVDRPLDEGPRSIVYLAREKERGEPVALKLVFREGWKAALPEDVFGRSLAVVAALDHPHIVPLVRYGVTERFFWYATRHVDGRSLADLLSSGGPLPLEVAMPVIGQVASALHYAHRRGVLHGDLQPSKVIVAPHGGALVRDFQVAAILERLGAPRDAGARRAEYIAPQEPGGSPPSGSADQYALAALAYECLSGAAPFTGGTAAEIMHRQALEAPPCLTDVCPEVPAAVSVAVQRAMNRKAAERFPSVLGFAAVLGVVAGPRVSPAPGTAPPASNGVKVLVDEEAGPVAPPTRRRRSLGLGALVVVAVAAGGVWWLRSSGLVEPEASRAAPPSDSALTAVRVDTVPGSSVATASPAVAPRENAPKPVPRAASPRPAPVPLARGRLTVGATPWGELYVDDQLIGNTPKVGVPVSAGTHRVRVVRDGFEPLEQVIDVPPGGEVRLTGLVLREVKP